MTTYSKFLTQLTLAHLTNARSRNILWLLAFIKWRPRRNRLLTTPWQEINRWALPWDLNFLICLSCCRLGWWDNSHRLFLYCLEEWLGRMLNIRCQFFHCWWITAQFIGDYPDWRILLPFESPSKGSSRRFFVFTFLNQNVNFVTILIDCPPKLMQHSIYVDTYPIKISSII